MHSQAVDQYRPPQHKMAIQPNWILTARNRRKAPGTNERLSKERTTEVALDKVSPNMLGGFESRLLKGVGRIGSRSIRDSATSVVVNKAFTFQR